MERVNPVYPPVRLKIRFVSKEEKKSQDKTKRVCIKVKWWLRKNGCNNLEEWLNGENNLYCGRHGRIFIGSGENKRIFHYKASIWHNPYSAKKYPNGQALILFEEYLKNNVILLSQIGQLKGKNLGCWCEPGNKCHVDILLKYLRK